MAPVMGFHSVILRPDSVNRVTPPMTTIPNTRLEHPRSQYPTERGVCVSLESEAPVLTRLLLQGIAQRGACFWHARCNILRLGQPLERKEEVTVL